MIKVENVSYKIAEKEILADINCEFQCGEITTILGANGAGKSSLLKVISGGVKPDQGLVTIDGKNINQFLAKDLAKKRAVLSQTSNINFPFTAFDIVMMGRSCRNLSFDVDVANHTLELLDVAHLAQRVFFTLSGGEQQRVQIARVLAQIWEEENAYLFLDEPTSALDLKHQLQLLEILQKLKEKNFAIICIMHDLHLALKYSDKLLLMHQGKLMKSGQVSEVASKENLSQIYEIDVKKIYEFGF